MADHAAALMFDGAAAFGAGTEGHIVFVVEFLVAFAVIFFGMLAYGLGDGVGSGGDPVFTEACGFMTADAD